MMRVIRFASILATSLPFGVSSAQKATMMPPIGIDSLVSHFHGMEDGREVHTLTRAGHGYRYTEELSYPGLMTRVSTIEFDSVMNVVRARSSGVLNGRKFGSDVEYTGFRAHGHASPLQGTEGSVAIDTLLPSSGFDGLALYPKLLSRAWNVGDAAKITIFDTDERSVTEQTFKIVGAERLELPSGPQKALRAELSTTQLPVTIWFTASRPHRLLKVASANGETVRVH